METFKKGQVVKHKVSGRKFVIIRRGFIFKNWFKVIDEYENNYWGRREEITASTGENKNG